MYVYSTYKLHPVQILDLSDWYLVSAAQHIVFTIKTLNTLYIHQL